MGSPHRAISAGLATLCSVVLVLATSLASAQTLLRDAEIEQYLRDYGDPLFEAAGLYPEAVDMYIVGDPNLNAFVTAGQKVFVHTGLITAAATPNQIEGVLAHETGHIAGGHQQRGAEAYARAGRPAMLSMLLGAAVLAAGGSPDAGMALFGLGQSVALSEVLRYSRGQEASADQAALNYLDTAGRSSRGLIEFFEILQNRQLITSSRIDPYMQSHPLAQRRVSLLQDRAQLLEFWEVGDSEAEIQRLRMIQAKIHGFMQDAQVTMRQYPLTDQSPQAHYARAVAYYRSSQLDKAMSEIQTLIDLEPENPFFQELKGQMLFEHGRIADSVTPHRRSVELAPQYALLRINLARALAALDQRETSEEAIRVLKRALLDEPDNSFAYSEMARAYARLGEENQAVLAQAESYYWRGALPEAHRFASLASDRFEEGTGEYVRAMDIIRASEDEARKARGQRR